MNNKFSEIFDIIKKSEKILITGHTSPDGDAIGSGLGLFLALNKLNEKLKQEAHDKGEAYSDKILRFILEDRVPRNLAFLPNSFRVEEVKNYDYNYEFDLMICLDSGNFNRIGEVAKLKTGKTIVVNIDHHISNDRFGNYNYVGDISSTSEIIFDFLKEMKLDIDSEIAESLYTGIVNDTGNFRHSNTTKKVFEVAAELVGLGANPNKIIKSFFDTKSMERLKLTGKVLSNFKFVENLNLVYYYISEKELLELGATSEDAGGFAELLLSFEGASVALLLREDKGYIKGSFRSKYSVDVNVLANLFDGGGHIKAAGFKTNKKFEEIIDIVIENMS